MIWINFNGIEFKRIVCISIISVILIQISMRWIELHKVAQHLPLNLESWVTWIRKVQYTLCQEMEGRKLRLCKWEKQRAGAKSRTSTVLRLSAVRICGMAVLTAWLYADTHTHTLSCSLPFSEAWPRLCQQ